MGSKRTRGEYLYDGIKAPWRDPREVAALVFHLAKRQLMIRYHGSALGFLWSFLNPLFNMLLYMFLFKIVFRGEIPNNVPFAAFFLAGYLVWNCLALSVNNNVYVIMECKPLLDSHAFPAWTLPASRVASAFFNLVMTLPVLLLLNAILGIFPSWRILLFPVALAMASCLALGVALLVSSITPFFRDLAQMTDVLLTVFYFASPILYPFAKIENSPLPDWAVALYQLNPVVGVAELMHYCFLPLPVSWMAVGWGAVGSLAVLGWGAWEFNRRKDDFGSVI
jgi:lipopolysaccharide transport system permease protein